jgi:3-oxoacyl-[acyl-carrier-protein] synthase III
LQRSNFGVIAMALSSITPCRIRAICSAVPAKIFDNLHDTTAFEPEEVDKVVKLAGVKTRHTASDRICSSDLCEAAARKALQMLAWDPGAVDALIMVTQSQDYFLPSTACVLQHKLGLRDSCAAFDVGLGCSGYAYGLWLASMMLSSGGLKRILLLHGETPTRFADRSDRAVALLFGDAGSATALDNLADPLSPPWWFSLHSDGAGFRDLIIEGGGFRHRFPEDPQSHFVHMNGANIFNFTIKRVPQLIEDTLHAGGISAEAIDYFIFHQSNKFIMSHLARKCKIPPEKIPFTIGEYGSTGGPSVPLTIVEGRLNRPADRALRLLLVAYGVGLSWASALIDLSPETMLAHINVSEP